MISIYWLIPAFIVGGCVGLVLSALLAVSSHDYDQLDNLPCPPGYPPEKDEP